ncbi:MAG: DUF481 domain-containing protein [Phycisphaerales bacterium]|nr:DUF481 domain-containing protein [Phycisphaerales bacterium]
MKNHPNICVLFAALALPVPVLAGESPTTLDARPAALTQPEEAGAETTTEEPIPNADRWILSGWKGTIEFGLTGASGNNDRFNLRAGASASRESDASADQLTLTYSYAKDDSTQTENRFEAKGRHDWKFPDDSPWRVYVGGSFEYDEFQDWDMRVSIGPGVGYEAIENDTTKLLLRAGVVATKEIGGSDNAWTPEADLGFDLEHKLTERQTLTASADAYPAIDDFGPYRLVGNVAWTIDVDPEVNLFLKLGIEDRYDSNPGPEKKRNDVNYFATLGWSF